MIFSVQNDLLHTSSSMILGANPYPTWEHVVFSTYHNERMDLSGRKVLYNWTDGSWRDLIADCMKKIVPDENNII